MSMDRTHETQFDFHKDQSQRVNIYSELANLDPDVADRITNAKTHGGRALDAIWSNPSLNTYQKIILLYLGSQLTYTASFENQYRYVSLSTIADATSISRTTVIRTLNGFQDKKGRTIGLIELGYIKKRTVSREEQIKGYANHYCLTRKLFDDYLLALIKKTNSTAGQAIQKKFRPGVAATPPQYRSDTTLVSQRHHPSIAATLKVPLEVPLIDPSNNVCVEKPSQLPSNTHTENQVYETPKILKTISHKKRANICDVTSDVGTHLKWKLSNTLRSVFHTKFVDNEDCGEIINLVQEATQCTKDEFRNMLNDLSQHENELVFKSRHFNVRSIAQDFIHWMTSKDEILKYEQKAHEKLKQEQAQLLLEYEKNKEEEGKKQEEVKEREKQERKKREADFYKLPKAFIDWFESCNKFSQKTIKETFIRDGFERFSTNIIPTLHGYQIYIKSRDKPNYEAVHTQ